MENKNKNKDYRGISIDIECPKCDADLLLDEYPTKENVMGYDNVIECIFCGKEIVCESVIMLKRIFKIEKVCQTIQLKEQ